MTKRIFAFFALFVMFSLLATTAARADLTITPKRIVFLGRGRSAEITLLNITDHTNTYRFGWSLMKANGKGEYELVPATKESDKDPFSVENMVFFSPRQVKIEPHGYQTIRLSLRRPSNLPFGEYRAHLTLTRLAHDEPIRQDPNAKTISMSMKVNLSFSVPVIVRQGEDKALKVSLSGPKLTATKGGGSSLDVDLTRDAGTFSTYGDVKVLWHPPKGSEIEIGTLSNIALYPEVKSRRISVPILSKENLTSGTIRVVYTGKLESDGTTWAEKSFPIGK